jgi:hypothetical protein
VGQDRDPDDVEVAADRHQRTEIPNANRPIGSNSVCMRGSPRTALNTPAGRAARVS